MQGTEETDHAKAKARHAERRSDPCERGSIEGQPRSETRHACALPSQVDARVARFRRFLWHLCYFPVFFETINDFNSRPAFFRLRFRSYGRFALIIENILAMRVKAGARVGAGTSSFKTETASVRSCVPALCFAR